MGQWIWINGSIMPMGDARIDVQDRGFQFADGVYEVVRVYQGRCFTLAEHLDRLSKSAEAVGISLPISTSALAEQIRKFVVLESLHEGMIYLQLTRGVAERNHVYPADIKPTLLFYASLLDPLPPVGGGAGFKLLPVPDERWRKCWIKSIALLANILAKNQAAAAGYDEAIFIDDGRCTEGASTNFFAVIDGIVATAPKGPKILPGITRQVLIDVARTAGVSIIERPILESEIASATELFITSSTREVMWVSHWGEREVSKSAGPITRKLHEAFRDWVRKDTGLENPHAIPASPVPA